jgi:hypothetical protein
VGTSPGADFANCSLICVIRRDTVASPDKSLALEQVSINVLLYSPLHPTSRRSLMWFFLEVWQRSAIILAQRQTCFSIRSGSNSGTSSTASIVAAITIIVSRQNHICTWILSPWAPKRQPTTSSEDTTYVHIICIQGETSSHYGLQAPETRTETGFH